MTLDDDLDDLLIEPFEAAPAEAAEVPHVDAAAAAQRLKADMQAAKVRAQMDIIKAPVPSPLHKITFPVYDRGAGGYRLIERAFGTPELKTLVKVLLDSLLSTDPNAAVEPSLELDTTAALMATTELFHGERKNLRWECSHSGRRHDSRGLIAADGTVNHRLATQLLNGISECMNEMHYNRGGKISSKVPGHEREPAPSGYDRYAIDSIHTSPDAWLFYAEHSPFMRWGYEEGSWMPALPTQWNPPPTERNQTVVGAWDFPRSAFKGPRPSTF